MKEKKRCSQNKQNLYPLFKGQESRFYSALSIIHYCPKFPVQKPTRGSSVRAKLAGKKGGLPFSPYPQRDDSDAMIATYWPENLVTDTMSRLIREKVPPS
ncbi:hypothetical protein CDAR_74971 [Caerostris darwini]|uniref:Uncharacterized protein n=1 Tax=Caerostris darwini TaxID=1538125 RepID=A0AAV4P472_9ARAC|nr:hypothetical protein CDAR_74971 [Caerostris darwini]